MNLNNFFIDDSFITTNPACSSCIIPFQDSGQPPKLGVGDGDKAFNLEYG